MTRGLPLVGAAPADYWALEESWECRQFERSRWDEDYYPEDDEPEPPDDLVEYAFELALGNPET